MDTRIPCSPRPSAPGTWHGGPSLATSLSCHHHLPPPRPCEHKARVSAMQGRHGPGRTSAAPLQPPSAPLVPQVPAPAAVGRVPGMTLAPRAGEVLGNPRAITGPWGRRGNHREFVQGLGVFTSGATAPIVEGMWQLRCPDLVLSREWGPGGLDPGQWTPEPCPLHPSCNV